MTKAKTNDKLAKSIEHANFVLKSAGAPLKAKELNTVLESHGYAPLNPTTLAREFKAIPVKGNSKVKFAYTVKAAAKSACKKACKKPCAKEAKKACKKPLPTPENSGKKRCVCGIDEAKANEGNVCVATNVRNGKPVGFCRIQTHGDFNIDGWNRRAMLHNLLLARPEARQNPGAFVIFAGAGDWPSEYDGVEVISNPSTEGAVLVPRSVVIQG